MINENEFIDSKELSKKLDKVILNEAKILKKNLKTKKEFNFNVNLAYV